MENPGLPKPNVSYRPQDPDFLDDRTIKGMICNPIYAGVPPFQRIISDEAWVQAATQLIAEEGPEQFLVNVLFMLRQSLENLINNQGNSAPVPVAEATSLYCYHDDFPLIEMHGAYVCVAEYIFEHLDDTPITDLISNPEPALVFQNGHTLPLISPQTGQPFRLADEDQFLNNLSGLSLIDAEWEDDTQAIILYFGHAPGGENNPLTEGVDPAMEESEAFNAIDSLAVHLDSIRAMTCPYLPGLPSFLDR